LAHFTRYYENPTRPLSESQYQEGKALLGPGRDGNAAHGAPEGTSPFGEYDWELHRYAYLIDTVKCIGCGMCVKACKAENLVPDGYFRTWVERYEISEEGEAGRMHRDRDALPHHLGGVALLARGREVIDRVGRPGGGVEGLLVAGPARLLRAEQAVILVSGHPAAGVASAPRGRRLRGPDAVAATEQDQEQAGALRHDQSPLPLGWHW
jgi:NAD-dependent dihydropyrimidine dehydrogenase PreA subunit